MSGVAFLIHANHHQRVAPSLLQIQPSYRVVVGDTDHCRRLHQHHYSSFSQNLDVLLRSRMVAKRRTQDFFPATLKCVIVACHHPDQNRRHCRRRQHLPFSFQTNAKVGDWFLEELNLFLYLDCKISGEKSEK